jgi:fatty-acyl-CoA synthase
VKQPTPDTLWRQQLRAAPQALLLDGSSSPLSREAFEALVQEQQHQLQARGVGSCDIVAWLGTNQPALLASLLACERLGAVLMPLNWRLAHSELLAQLLHAGTALLWVDDSLREAGTQLQQAWQAAGPVERATAQAEDLLLVYTSGTTGTPKGAMHTAAQVAANAQAAITAQGLGRDTRALAVLPMFHVGGLCIQLLPTVLAGGVVRLHARFEPALWLADVDRWRPTTSVLVPATMRAVLDLPQWSETDLSSLKFLMTGSSVVPLALIEAFHSRGVPVAQVYGSTETGPFSIALAPHEALAYPGSVGRPVAGVQVRLVDAQGADVPDGQVGDIRLRGANVMRGYHRMPQHPDFVDGWFHSGDQARRDTQGRYDVVGRSKDMIISGGENIYPAEIENLVIGVPGVAECAVVGLPDERWGETPVLAVVSGAGAMLDLDAVRSSFSGRLARFKHPRQIVQLPSLPKTALGKVQKSALAKLLSTSLGNPDAQSGR